MSDLRPVAFYAPLKSPDHPSPSGDRTMARLLMKALAKAGYGPMLASELRTLDKAGDPAAQERLKRESQDIASRLIAHYRALPEQSRPGLWFTYHVYYKAPDWIGPRVADALGIPYVIAEGSRAAKRAGGRWALAHEGAEAALDRADSIFVMTAQDREALELAQAPGQILADLPPFLDVEEWRLDERLVDAPGGDGPRLLTVAMMRQGDKLASYRILAASLERVRHLPWVLDIVGDGDAREEVSRLFAPFGGRIQFHGQVENRTELRMIYECADLFVWPAVNEAYGMVLLEAQLFGCPVVAGSYGGVASVVKQHETGLLCQAGDSAAFAEAVSALLTNPDRRNQFGTAARDFVTRERDLDRAAFRLHTVLAPLLAAAGE
ncbi:glycosyltransferase family 4 protein [Microvirga aerophila]|uniref:Glycosyl transferase n=1 Tax=Microvirga aerophila TaxID=670291 RepID=A0A512BRX0_9HYPH|nr:glycosyltransferase family 4 protein [Microvirga aerophila]GEO14681.1 glycosyl transferase [Microvirga aerophila]